MSLPDGWCQCWTRAVAADHVRHTIDQLRIPPDLPAALRVRRTEGSGGALVTLCLPRALAIAWDYRPARDTPAETLARLARIHQRGPHAMAVLSIMGPVAVAEALSAA